MTRIQVDTLEQEVIPGIPLQGSPRLYKEIRDGILFGISHYYHISHALEIKEISFKTEPGILTHDWAYFMDTDQETSMDEYLKAVKLDEYFKK